MKLFIKQIILFILVCIIFFNCDSSKKKKPSLPPGFDYIIFLGTFAWGTKEEGIVVDNKNGTLNYTYKLIQTNPYFGNRVLVDKTILIRRCLIGQVFRQTENDCQGTGTKETVWGASRLQWCPTNDRSCEIDGKADPTKSPAAKACADDTFLNKKWMLPSKDDGLAPLMDTHSKGGFYEVKFDFNGTTKLIESFDERDSYFANSINSAYYTIKSGMGRILCKQLI